MESFVASGLDRFLEYGVVGMGWPLFLLALWDERRRAGEERSSRAAQRETDLELIERIIGQTSENTHVLRQLVRVIEASVEE